MDKEKTVFEKDLGKKIKYSYVKKINSIEQEFHGKGKLIAVDDIHIRILDEHNQYHNIKRELIQTSKVIEG